jgi:hypothetical protein
MSTHHVFLPDGTSKHGNLHPEIAEPSLEILKRDIRKFSKYPCSSFIRKPYGDLEEVETALGLAAQRRDVVAVLVIRVVRGETNARIFLDKTMLDEELAKGEILNLYSKPSGKGFGGK